MQWSLKYPQRLQVTLCPAPGGGLMKPSVLGKHLNTEPPSHDKPLLFTLMKNQQWCYHYCKPWKKHNILVGIMLGVKDYMHLSG